MPPGYEPLLAAVCAEPWSDLPRLVFADFLDDHGDHDRAEFIRLQCHLAANPQNPHERGKRAGRLLRTHREAWVAELPTVTGVDWRGYERGFMAEAVVYDSTTLPHTLAAVAAAAPIHSLIVGTSPEGWRWLAMSDVFRTLTRFEVSNRDGVGIDDESVESLATNPSVSQLRRLWLHGRRRHAILWGMWSTTQILSDRAALALARSPHLTRLDTLQLIGADLSPGAQDQLVERFGRRLTVIP